MTDPDAYTVKATNTSFRIVDAVRDRDGATITGLATHLDLSKSAVYKHLTTLDRLGYVRRDGDSFHLGLRFLDQGTAARDRLPVFGVAKPELENLASVAGEFAALVVEDRGWSVYVYGTGGRGDVDVREGTTVPPHESAAGRAVLAHLPEDRVSELLGAHDVELTDGLRNSLTTVRDRGLAFGRDEVGEGTRTVAAPVLTNGRVLASVCVVGPVGRLSGKRLQEDVSGLVLSTARAVQNSYTPD